MQLQSLLAARAAVDLGEGLKDILSLANDTQVISFSGGFPDPITFPGSAVADLVEELVKAGDWTAMQYSPTQGLESVRDYLLQRVASLQGVRPGPGELMVTSGAVEAIELVCKRFLDPGDVVLVEAPTYLGAIMALRSHEAQIVGVGTDANGLKIDALEELLRGGVRPKLLYTIPDFQNPRGVSLSHERRAKLVELAERYGFLIVEDVAYRELYLDEPPAASLWSRNQEAVVQIGTFSKTFFPGVRLGWAVGPALAIDEMVAAKQNTDQCAGALGQRLLEEYGRRGLLDQGIAVSRELYRRRRDRLAAALQRCMPGDTRWTVPRGGFFVWLEGPEGLDSVELGRQARAHGVAFVPGVFFYADGQGHNTMRLAYSRVDGEDLDEGCRRLGHLLRRAA